MRATVVLMLVAGCASGPSYYLVHSTLVPGEEQSAPQVTPTAAFQTATVSSVALLAPDECANEAATGVDLAAVGTLVRLRCGVEMALIERELTEAGYVVYSWRAIDDIVRHEEHVTPVAAAQRLGADVLVQINALERSTGQVNLDARWERQVFRSSRAAEQRGTPTVSSGLARSLKALVRPSEDDILAKGHLAVTIDATIVLVSSAQAVWFYHWSKLEALAAATETELLAACGKGRCWIPEGTRAPEAPRESGAEDRNTVSIGGSAASREAAAYLALTRAVVKDLVARFSTVHRDQRSAAP